MAAGGLDYMLLLFIRVSGMTLSSPIFGRQNIPAPAKISYSLALAYFFFTVLPKPGPLSYGSVLVFALLCAKELLIGLIMGYLLTLFFSVSFTAGQLMDMQMGFGMANVFDQQSNASIPMMGNLLNTMMMLIFISVGGFERLMAMLELTFRHLPVGGLTVSKGVAWIMAQLFCEAFVLGLRMALPVVISGLLGEAAMGMLVRTVPQMNVFVIGLPLKVLLGFVVLAMVLPVYVSLGSTVFDSMFSGMERAFTALIGA